MVKLKISKERLEREEEMVSDRVYGGSEHYYYDKRVNCVDIDTSKGDINIYIDGKRIKPKRYVLPMEGTDSQAFTTSKRTVKQYCYIKDGHWDFWPAWDDKDAAEKGHTVTQADIDTAPDWVKSITPVEVKADD